MTYRCTIDIDFKSKPWSTLLKSMTEKEVEERLLVKLLSEECVEFVRVCDSPSQCGRHVEVFSSSDCSKCYKCRLLFDDQERFASDMLYRDRPERRDILFSSKEKMTIGSILRSLGYRPSPAADSGSAGG